MRVGIGRTGRHVGRSFSLLRHHRAVIGTLAARVAVWLEVAHRLHPARLHIMRLHGLGHSPKRARRQPDSCPTVARELRDCPTVARQLPRHSCPTAACASRRLGRRVAGIVARRSSVALAQPCWGGWAKKPGHRRERSRRAPRLEAGFASQRLPGIKNKRKTNLRGVLPLMQKTTARYAAKAAIMARTRLYGARPAGSTGPPPTPHEPPAEWARALTSRRRTSHPPP